MKPTASNVKRTPEDKKNKTPDNFQDVSREKTSFDFFMVASVDAFDWGAIASAILFAFVW